MKTACPRCDGRLSQFHATEPPSCVPCGWEDYDYTIPQRERRRAALSDAIAISCETTECGGSMGVAESMGLMIFREAKGTERGDGLRAEGLEPKWIRR